MTINSNIPSNVNNTNNPENQNISSTPSETPPPPAKKTAATSAPPTSPLSNDTLETNETKKTSTSPQTNISAQTPQLSEIAYQKIVGDASKKFEELLARIAELDSYYSNKFNSQFADMIAGALESYLSEKAKIVITPPATGAPGEKPSQDGTVAPGGSQQTKAANSKSPKDDGPPGTTPPTDPYASIEKAFDDKLAEISQTRLAIDHYSDYLSQYGTGSLNLKSLQLSQNSEDLKQLNYALDQSAVKGDKSISEKIISDNPKSLFNQEIVKILTPILGKENAENISDLVQILTTELLSLNGLKAGKDAIQLLSKAPTSNEPITNQKAEVAGSVALIQNLSKLLTPEGKAFLQSAIEAIFSKNPSLSQIPEDVKTPTIQKLTDDIQISVVKMIFLIAESGFKIGDDLSQLINASASPAEDDDKNMLLDFSQDNVSTLQPLIPTQMPETVKQDPTAFLQKINSNGNLSPKEFTEEVVNNFLAAGVPPPEAYLKASQITLISLSHSPSTAAFKSLPLEKQSELSFLFAKDLQEPRTRSDSYGTLLSGENLSQFGAGMEKALIDQGQDPAEAEDVADELIFALETPPAASTITPLASNTDTSSNTDISNPNDVDHTQQNKTKITALHQNISNALTTLLQKNLPASQISDVASQLLEVLTGYPHADAISSPQSSNPHSLVNVAKDKITTTTNYFANQDRNTTHAVKETENFKNFIKEHSDLTTFAEQLRSPATALVMTWGLMNEGTFKFSGHRNSIDFLG